MDEEDDGRFVTDFGIDDKRVDGARAVFDLDPFLVARGFIEDGFSPILRGGGRASDEGEGGAEKKDRAGRGGEAGFSWRKDTRKAGT